MMICYNYEYLLNYGKNQYHLRHGSIILLHFRLNYSHLKGYYYWLIDCCLTSIEETSSTCTCTCISTIFMMTTSPKKNKLIGLWADVLNVTRKREDNDVHVLESEVQKMCVAIS